MKLGEWLKHYRLENNLSMQELADVCGFSKAYVSLLEKGINPTTNKPFSPTMQTFEKIARGTGQDIDSLLRLLDDEQPITIQSPLKLSQEETELLDVYRRLDDNKKNLFRGIVDLFNTSVVGNSNVVHSVANINGSAFVGINGGVHVTGAAM